MKAKLQVNIPKNTHVLTAILNSRKVSGGASVLAIVSASRAVSGCAVEF